MQTKAQVIESHLIDEYLKIKYCLDFEHVSFLVTYNTNLYLNTLASRDNAIPAGFFSL